MSDQPAFEVDKLVHEPARLGILTVLDSARDADFQFLWSVLGLTKGNLSSHLSKLEAAGLVGVTKAFEGKVPRTRLAITPLGRRALAQHWAQLDAIRRLGERRATAETSSRNSLEDAASPMTPFQ